MIGDVEPAGRGQPTMTETRANRRTGRSPILIGAVAVVLALAVAGGYGLWYLFLRGSEPAAVADASVPALPSTTVASSSPLASGGLAGTWKIDTSIGSSSDWSDSFVGYRVQEELASIGANTAVGRTPKVDGTLSIDGTKVTAGTITADLTALKSNDDRRDGQLRRQGLETSQFPTAEFVLASPIDFGAAPADGQVVSATAKGRLTLHGVTKDVEIPLKARLSGSTIAVTGSLPIAFADYNITKPSSFVVLTVEDQGTMELQLFFTHA
jgi:polyisoprenoid-binding protein YceI